MDGIGWGVLIAVQDHLDVSLVPVGDVGPGRVGDVAEEHEGFAGGEGGGRHG
jgi:hypothetical protein